MEALLGGLDRCLSQEPGLTAVAELVKDEASRSPGHIRRESQELRIQQGSAPCTEMATMAGSGCSEGHEEVPESSERGYVFLGTLREVASMNR